MKTPVAKPNVVIIPGRSPFMPAVFIQQSAGFLGGSGAASPFTGPREDGPHAYLNYDAVTPILYNGQNQNLPFNQIKPTPSLPMHVLPGASPPSYSKIP